MELLLIFITLFLGMLSIILLQNRNYIRVVALATSSIVLLLSIIIGCKFDKNLYGFQQVLHIEMDPQVFGYSFYFGFDSLSLAFFILTTFLIFLCIQKVWDEEKVKAYTFNLLLTELFLIIVFTTLDLFLFYIFFEAILLPMFIMIAFGGSRERKVRANYLFFFYTAAGSALMLLAIILILNLTGTTSFDFLFSNQHIFTRNEQLFIWIAFFISFASKIPMFPFHIWLPEAHVEAPTVGSVLLAGILLKLGVYGFLRCSFMILPEMSEFLSPIVYIISAIGIVVASLTAIRQTDLKRIIAYSSIAHMNLVTLGIFSFSIIGIEGAIFQSLSHGFVAGGLFLLVGILYDRFHSRHLYYYGGLVHFMPLYIAAFLLLTLANIALPGTSSFVGEFLLLQGTMLANTSVGVFATLGVILSGAYSLWLYNRIAYGNLKTHYTKKFRDLTFQEFMIVFPLVILVFLFGVAPNFILRFFETSAMYVAFFII